MTKHLDDTLISELRELMEDDFAVLLDAYLTEAPVQKAAIEAAFDDFDSEALRRSAHSLKGSSANIGATLLADFCQRIEASAHGANADEIAGLLAGLELEFSQVSDEVRSLYES